MKLLDKLVLAAALALIVTLSLVLVFEHVVYGVW